MSSGCGATLQIVNILSNIIAINTITFPVSFCIMLREIVVKLNHFSGNVCGIEDVINVCVYLVTEARRWGERGDHKPLLPALGVSFLLIPGPLTPLSLILSANVSWGTFNISYYTALNIHFHSRIDSLSIYISVNRTGINVHKWTLW